ncbi:helix-turn-helix domain-containing protein [Filimonas effusa]|uniref:XRE family transcriptional regulator n=1 Tax=Filimonas effusa TaxID=2508721 RepID=A0A4Q1DCB8_9BACT|nr:helix-turn-helix transcriptional regulator [Filimonas effusa]RXK87000.1 XRE family transcriptional regulator [Filimonas effusa]
MNIPLRLIFYREHFGWTQEKAAQALGISVESYNELENGRLKINGLIAQKLANLYNAPFEIFVIDTTSHYHQAEVIYTNCSFGGSLASGYINNNHTDRGIDEIMYLRKQETDGLKAQIEDLRQQNSALLQLNESLAKFAERQSEK